MMKFFLIFLLSVITLNKAFLHTTIGCSNKLRTRTMSMQQNTQDTNKNSLTNIFKTTKKITSALLIGSSLTLSSAPVFAVEAGQLFAKSEEAYDLSQANYKTAETEWNSLKKQVEEEIKVLTKSVKMLNQVATDVTSVPLKLTQLTTDGDSLKLEIQKEIDTFTALAETKYTEAEASSLASAKPSVTAELFKQANSNKNMRIQAVKALKQLNGVNSQNNAVAEKTKVILNNIQALSSQADKLLADQNSAYNDLSNGVNSNFAACKEKVNECIKSGSTGVKQFKSGAAKLITIRDSFNKIVKNSQKEINELKDVKNGVQRGITELEREQKERTNWESENKLKLKITTPTFQKYVNEANTVNKALIQKYDQLFKQVSEIGKNREESQKMLRNQLKLVQDKLEGAEKSSISADKLLEEARKQGEKESVAYLKEIKSNKLSGNYLNTDKFKSKARIMESSP